MEMDFSYTTTKLERVKYALYKAWSEEEIVELANKPDMELAMNVKFTCNEFAVRVVGFVYKQELRDVSVKYPCDWWQAFKERWFPKWLLKRCPVIYRNHEYKAVALYPMLALPKDPYIIRVSDSKWESSVGMIRNV